MTTEVIFILALALILVSVASAVSIYFVCNLVEKVAKLNAVSTPQEYAALINKPKKAKKVKIQPTGETGGDGTLVPKALKEMRERDTAI